MCEGDHRCFPPRKIKEEEEKKSHEKQQEKMPTWGTVLGPTKATVPAKAFQVSKEDNMASLRVLLAPD